MMNAALHLTEDGKHRTTVEGVLARGLNPQSEGPTTK